MGFVIWRLILGALCAGAVLMALERLVVWRRTDPAGDDEQWRNDWFGGRMPALPFVSAAAGVAIVTVLSAHVLFGVLSHFGGLIAFLTGAAIVAALTRKRLLPVRAAVLEAVREFKLVDDQQAGPDRLRPRRNGKASVLRSTDVVRPAANRAAEGQQAAAGRERPPRRKRRASVPASIDAQVKQAIERPAGGRSTLASPWTAPTATETNARQRDEQALVGVRRELIAHLQARSAALAALMPAAASPAPIVPAVPGPAVAQPSVEGATAGAEPEDWQTEAAAQREMWRRAGEAQRQQWRDEAQALQKRFSRPLPEAESPPS